MFEKYADMVGVKEFREMLGIGKNAAYGMISRNEILHIRVGKSIRIPKKSVIEFCLTFEEKIKN